MSTVANLDLNVRAKTDELEKRLKNAESSLNSFGGSLKRVGEIAAGTFAGTLASAAVTGGISLIGDGLSALAGGLTSAAGKLIDFGKAQFEGLNSSIMLAETLGVSVNSLEILKLAAKNVDVEFGVLEKSFLKVTDLLNDSLGDPDGKATQTLNKLGLSADQLSKLPVDKQLRAVVDAINALPAESKLQAAMDVFGSKQALQVLKLTGDVIDDATNKARRWGLTIGPETADQVAQLDDALDDLTAMLEGVGRSIFVSLLDPIKNAFKYVRDKIDEVGIENIVKTIVQWIDWGANKIIEALEQVINSIGGAKGALLQLIKTKLEAEAFWASFKGTSGGLLFDPDKALKEGVDLEMQLGNVKAEIANLKSDIRLPRVDLSGAVNKHFDQPTAGANLTALDDKAKAEQAAEIERKKLLAESVKNQREAAKKQIEVLQEQLKTLEKAKTETILPQTFGPVGKSSSEFYRLIFDAQKGVAESKAKKEEQDRKQMIDNLKTQIDQQKQIIEQLKKNNLAVGAV